MAQPRHPKSPHSPGLAWAGARPRGGHAPVLGPWQAGGAVVLKCAAGGEGGVRKRRRGSCLKCQGFISHSPCPHRSERSCLSCRLWIILISREVLRLLMGPCCQEEPETWQVRAKQLLGSPKPLAPAQNEHTKNEAEPGEVSLPGALASPP